MDRGLRDFCQDRSVKLSFLGWVGTSGDNTAGKMKKRRTLKAYYVGLEVEKDFVKRGECAPSRQQNQNLGG